MVCKVMIVDDEEPARRELRHLLGGIAGVSVAGEAANGQKAIKEILLMKPDVVFLDIQMPMGGLEVARMVNQMKKPPFIIFVTAYENFALEAFEVHAFNYLLKPVQEEKLLQTMLWIQQHLEKEGRPKVLQRIPAEKKGRLVMLDLKDVCFFCSWQDKALARTYDEELIICYNLKTLEERLNNDFFRCHRKYIINLTQVHEVLPWFNGVFTLSLRDNKNTEIPVGRQRVRELRELLGLVK